MSRRYAEFGDGSNSGDSRPRAWLTRSQLDHSVNYIGSDKNRLRSDAIRVAEQIGSDGMVRALPALSMSYQESLKYLGMESDDDLL